MSNDHDALVEQAAAYVLGSLSDAESEAFELHMIECGECTDAVSELLEAGGLIDGLSLGEIDVGPLDAADQALIDRATAAAVSRADADAANRRPDASPVVEPVTGGGAGSASAQTASAVSLDEVRARRGRAPMWLAAAAAVVLVVGALAIGLGRGDDRIDLAFDDPTTTGSVVLEPKDWGTAITLDLAGLPGADTYQLWAIDENGEQSPVVGWPSSPGGFARVTGGTPLTPDDLDSFVVTSSDPDDVLFTVPV